MSAEALFSRYQSAFGNIDEIAMPQLIMDPEFLALLEQALARRSAVTEAELRETFPDEDWEAVIS